MSIATAIDSCLAQFQEPKALAIAKNIQSRVITALTATNSTRTTTLPNTQAPDPAKPTQQSWANIAKAAHRPQAAQQNKNTQKQNTSRTTQHKEDLRIFISAPTAVRLQQLDPFAVRKEICLRAQGISLQDIPIARPIPTGWSILPATKEARERLLTQENQKALI